MASPVADIFENGASGTEYRLLRLTVKLSGPRVRTRVHDDRTGGGILTGTRDERDMRCVYGQSR